MAVFMAYLVLFLAMTGHSSASYCLCKDGVPDQQLQKNIDYACGAGANCNQILQNGPCFNPNTVKDHCNYAVNSYYQAKGQVAGSCDFSGTATVSPTPPQTATSTCVYPSSPGNTGAPTTNPGSTPTTSNSTNTPTTLTPGSSTNPTTNPTFGLGPSGTTTAGGINPDNTNGSGTVGFSLLASLAAAVLLWSLICSRV